MHGDMCSSRSGAMSSSAACSRRAPLPSAAPPRSLKRVVIAAEQSQTPIARLYQVYASLNSPAASASFPQLLQARPPRVHVVRPRLGQRKRLRQCGGWRGLPRKVLPKRDLHLWPPLTEGIPLGCLPRGDGVGDCVQLCLGEQASRDRPCESGIKVLVECHIALLHVGLAAGGCVRAERGSPPASRQGEKTRNKEPTAGGRTVRVCARESRGRRGALPLSAVAKTRYTRNYRGGVEERYRTSGLLQYRATSYDSHMSASSASFSLRLMEMGRAPLARRGGCGTLVVGWAVSSAASWSSAGSSW